MKKMFFVLIVLLLSAESYSQQWVNKFNYSGSSKLESANIVLTDASANVYLVGTSVNGSANAIPLDNDIVVYKYNSAGTQQWVVTYGGAASAKDTVRKAVLDANGNIYLTGCTTINNSDSTEILTMMINTSGTIVWNKTYHIPGATSYYDCGNDITIDAAGNAFVTGVSSGIFIFLKYNSAGTLLLTKNIIGQSAEGNSVFVDGSGNIYLSATYIDLGWGGDGVEVMKYNSAGVQLWIKGGYTGNSVKTLTDASGNVFVAYNISNGDGKLVKYSSAGTELFNISTGSNFTITDMELDGFGNIYLCGSIRPPGFLYSIGVVEVFLNGGTLIWSATQTDITAYIQFKSMIVDASLNVFVTGYYGAKTTTVKYNSSGVKQWGVSYTSSAGNASANSIVIDNAGNPLIAGDNDNGGTGQDFLVVKYTNIGGNHWNRNINRLVSFNEVVTASKQDASGNYILTGYVNLGKNFYGVETGYGIIEKINSSGTIVWSYIDTSYTNVRYNDLDIDDSGNIFVTGTENENWIVMKFSSAGSILLNKSFNGAGSGYDEGKSIALDSSGNICTCGNVYNGALNNLDMVTTKYNSAGVIQWTQYYANSGGNDDAVKIRVDAFNNIVVGSNIYVVNTHKNDIYFSKYNPAGVEQIGIYFVGTAGEDDLLSDIIIDNNNDFFLTGSINNNISNNDLLLVKISNAGNVLWNVNYNSSGASNEKGYSLTTDKNGNVFVCGYVNSSGTNRNLLTMKYNSAGVQQWTKSIVNPVGGLNYLNSVSADTNGNIFVTGRYFASGNYNVIALKYNSTGNELVRLFYDGAGNGDCEGAKGFLNSSGDFIIAANAFESPQKQNIDLINFSRESFAITMKIIVGVEGLWNGTTQTRDSLEVYIRNSFAPYSKVDSAMAYLNTTCDDTISFYSAPSANYFVSVSHRNSLETWSAVTVPLALGTFVIQNFTGNQFDAYGSNLIFYNNKWCIFSGDINKDGYINGNDFTTFSTQFGQNGYLHSDLNNDGVVNGNDFTFYSTSFGKTSTHP